MSRTEKALERLGAAVERLESAAKNSAGSTAEADAALRAEIERLGGENDALAERLNTEAGKNRDLGDRLDAAIAKLNSVLEQN